MKNVKVSVITIVLNRADTIEKTIKSVLNQSYLDVEYIIIDGGSTDGTLDIIKKYKDKIKYWTSEPDHGISDAFNKGVSKATGELIAILNADDWYNNNTVQTIINNYTDKIDIYCANINIYDLNNNLRFSKKSKIHFAKYSGYIMHPTVFMRKSVYNNIGLYDLNLKIAMDFDLLLRAINQKKIVKYIPKTIANMRIQGASSDVKKMLKEELYVIRKNSTGIELLLGSILHYLIRLRWKLFMNSRMKLLSR